MFFFLTRDCTIPVDVGVPVPHRGHDSVIMQRYLRLIFMVLKTDIQMVGFCKLPLWELSGLNATGHTSQWKIALLRIISYQIALSRSFVY
jgi:hypothetical protein